MRSIRKITIFKLRKLQEVHVKLRKLKIFSDRYVAGVPVCLTATAALHRNLVLLGRRTIGNLLMCGATLPAGVK